MTEYEDVDWYVAPTFRRSLLPPQLRVDRAVCTSLHGVNA